jgi:hypothetical protein
MDSQNFNYYINKDLPNLDNFELDKQEIDKFNKFKLMKMILNNLIRRLRYESQDTLSKEIVIFYESFLTNYLISENFSKVKENFSILFTDKNQIVTNQELNDQITLKILSLFEEELRFYIKNKTNFLLKYLKPQTQNKDNINLISIFEEIHTLIDENYNLINEIVEKFKVKVIDKEEKLREEIKNKILNYQNLLTDSIDELYRRLTKEQIFVLLEYTNEKIQKENNLLSDEINELEFKVSEYESQGEILDIEVKEYKKLCNLIECYTISQNSSK